MHNKYLLKTKIITKSENIWNHIDARRIWDLNNLRLVNMLQNQPPNQQIYQPINQKLNILHIDFFTEAQIN